MSVIYVMLYHFICCKDTTIIWISKKYFVAIGKNDAFGCVLGERIRVGEANKIIFLFCRMEK